MNPRQRISDFQQLVNTKAAEIRREADSAWAPIRLNQTEPRIVYSFLSSTSGGVGHLNRTLGPLLSAGARTVKFAGIFLHQKPMVRGLRGIGNSPKRIGNTCELGDLQLLFLYVSKNKSLCQCRSTIFQAKLRPSPTGPVISHEDQRRLFDKCQGFKYETVLEGNVRNLPWKTADRERALQYLFIGQLPIQARLIPSDQGKGAFVDFGELVFRFLSDSTGLDVKVKPTNGKNWDRIVWDQIENVAKTQFGHHGPRNAALQQLLNRFNSFEDPNEFFCGDTPNGPPSHETRNRPSGGIPLLMIIVSDKGLDELAELSKPAEAAPKTPPPGLSQATQAHLASLKYTVRKPRKPIGSYLTGELTSRLQFVTEENDYESILREIVERVEHMSFTKAEAQRLLAVLQSRPFPESSDLQMLITGLKSRLSQIGASEKNLLKIKLGS